MTVVAPSMTIVGQILRDLSVCLCAQIEVDGVPVCECGVLPGGDVSLEYSGDCDSACGQAWVRMTTAYPSVSLGNPTDRPGNCTAGIGIEVELGIARCIDVGDGDEPPSPEVLAEASVLQASDMLTMWKAIACCRQSKDWIIGQYTPFGPQGGMVGGILTVGILVL